MNLSSQIGQQSKNVEAENGFSPRTKRAHSDTLSGYLGLDAGSISINITGSSPVMSTTYFRSVAEPEAVDFL